MNSIKPLTNPSKSPYENGLSVADILSLPSMPGWPGPVARTQHGLFNTCSLLIGLNWEDSGGCLCLAMNGENGAS